MTDPIQPGRTHFSTAWADTLPSELNLLEYDLGGRFHFIPNGPNHRDQFTDHLEAIAAYVTAYSMIQDLGDLEHTGDWDWWVGVTLRDGTRLGDYLHVNPDDEDHDGPYCDGIVFTNAKTPHDVSRLDGDLGKHTLTLVMWSTDPVNDVKVRVSDIASIEIGQR